MIENLSLDHCIINKFEVSHYMLQKSFSKTFFKYINDLLGFL